MRGRRVIGAAVGLAVLAAGTLGALAATAPPPEPQTKTEAEAPPANASALRFVKGRYDYLDLKTGALRGRESFILAVHPDGGRTLTAVTDIFSRAVQVTSTVAVDPRFRPLDAYVSIYTQGRLKGRGHFRFVGDAVESDLDGPAGRVTRRDAVGEAVSIVTHPIALDGWHFWHVDPKAPPKRATLVYVDGAAKFDEPMLGKIMTATYAALGTRSVTTPAGTFEAEGFSIDGHSEIWVATEDRLVVRYVWPSLGREYVLAALGPGP